MELRELKLKDAPLMLEWMHDKDITKDLHTNFAVMTLERCEQFILDSWSDSKNMHLAISDKDDEYLGTVSLKNIDYEKSFAEFAITIRKCAMGTGVSKLGMDTILEKAIKDLNLNKVYWCVNKSNQRAIKFYDKNKFIKTSNVPKKILERYPESISDELIWYVHK